MLVFVVNGWGELTEAPNLVRLIPNLVRPDPRRCTDQGANQYRVFSFDEDGAIRLCHRPLALR